MRTHAAMLSVLALVACSTTPTATAPPAATQAPATTSAESRGALLLGLAGQAGAPSRADIERLFGAADVARQDGAGVALTYRLNTCALLLVFTADAQSAMRLAEAHPSARQSSQAAPSLEQCAAEAEARRS